MKQVRKKASLEGKLNGKTPEQAQTRRKTEAKIKTIQSRNQKGFTKYRVRKRMEKSQEDGQNRKQTSGLLIE